ncbi:MAG: sulfur oxidation c-type cytochrome SoxA [Rhodoferax sp.]|nr:sulfur oxidation c-type cytochrome SoxA [Rhodoferax sp.]
MAVRGRCSADLLCAALFILPLAVMAADPSPIEPSARRSGFDSMSPPVQAMQLDDRRNPAMLWLAEGRSLWTRIPDTGAPSCAQCHGPVDVLRGVATRFPRYDARLGQAINLGQRIALCRDRHQKLPAWAPQHPDAIALEVLVAHASRGLPLQPDPDPRLDETSRLGERLFRQRFGQLNLSCAQCHDQRAGSLLGGTVIPQGHATGYPIYRLEWQGMGTLQRRLRSCLSGVRAEPFAYGSRELVALELHLARRAAGMPLETPAVRP